MRLKKPSQDFDAPAMERAVLARWKKEQTFAKSLAKNPKSKRFTFYDGPPFATGLPHYGHLLQGTIKDIIPRFKTMQGCYVERRFGWDCHGLPVEYELEKELGIKSRQEILKMGVGPFNDACRSIVLRHTKDWEQTTTRLGRWIDFENDYRTMDPDYMESIWWVVKTLHEKGLLYEGRKSMHICPRCATPLSNFEVTQNYRDRTDPSAFVKFPLADQPSTSLVAWTTTPWTLPANVLLAVNPKLTYVEVELKGEKLIVAESRIAETFGNEASASRKVLAKELIGQKYEPPFLVSDLEGKHYEVVSSDAVTADEGTGVLHVAPAFGEEDLAIGEREEAAFIQHIDITGKVGEPAPKHYRDKQALDINELVLADLKHEGRLLRHEQTTHSYPHCWRCETPLLNFATSSWFVAVTKLKQRLLAENQTINWVPAHLRDGRFGKWLEGARDWSISRNRFWGNPVPIWKCGDGHVTVIGSRDELAKLSGKHPKDLHKQHVDAITFPCPDCGEVATRIEDVLDCWFESGSMPYATQHYPFEHKSEFAKSFPADFIAEALDQTRGWFYTLHVLGVALKDSKAFKNVVTTGLIQAEDGKKMSKSLKNYPEPEQIFDRFGADSLRLYMVMEPIVRGDDLRFSERGAGEVFRNFTLTLWNTYSFLATYAAADGWEVALSKGKPTHLLDRWILSRLASVTRQTTDALESYDLMTGARGLLEFLDELSNWYVRRSRRRFSRSESDTDKQQAYATLHHALTTFCQLAAPFAPFITEHLYKELGYSQSVHLADWPKTKGTAIDEPLEQAMAQARQIVSLGLAARSKANLRVRQPLSEVRIIFQKGKHIKDKEVVQIIADELNVKQVNFVEQAASFAKEIAQPVPTVIGPLLGKDAQSVIAAIKRGEYTRQGDKLEVGKHTLPPEAVTMTFEHDDSFAVEGNAELVVGLDTDVDQALAREGLAREIIRHIQQLRKDSGLAIDEVVGLELETGDPELKSVISGPLAELTMQETLTKLGQEPGKPAGEKTVQIDRREITISIKKIS